MSSLLHIEEPAPRSRPALPPPQWKAFLELGFRPLYIAGCLWAAVSVALWVFAGQWLTGPLPSVLWHAHEMLWGFVATIAVGFLFTAGTNWTGINPLQGRALGALVLVWTTARIALLLPWQAAFALGAVCNALFFAWAAVALARSIYAARSRRNYGIPLLVLGLGLSNALFLWEAHQGHYEALMQRYHAGLLCMAVLTLLVGRRVIPFFAARATGRDIPLLADSGPWQLGAGVAAIACLLLGWMPGVTAALAVSGLLALWQWLRWQPWAVHRVPLLWVLYAGYAALGLGLLVAAAHAGGWVQRAAWPVHVIGASGFAVLIIGMVTRTALGHTGRPLQADGLIVAAYLCIIGAGLFRLLALLPTAFTLGALHLSATLWVLGFGLYLWRFVPMLVRPRADQARGKPVVLKPAAAKG